MIASDGSLSFSIPTLNARGRLVRLESTLAQILSAHGYPPAIEALLTESLVVTALLGTLLKDAEGQLTLQAQAEGGVITLLVCDYQAGAVRGYVQHDAEAAKALPFTPSLTDLFGSGYLCVTFDQATSGERYQGIVPLEGKSIAEAIESYFAQSEQIPSLVRVGIDGDVAGGLLLQHLAEGEEGRERLHTRLDHPDWEQVAMLGSTIKANELGDPALPLETIAWRLFSEAGDVRVSETGALSRGCRCDPDHIRGVLARFPEDERAAMADDHGIISVDCAFCAKAFPIIAAEL